MLDGRCTVQADDYCTVMRKIEELTRSWLARPLDTILADDSLVGQRLAAFDTLSLDFDVAIFGFCRWGQQRMYDFLADYDDPEIISTVEQFFLETVDAFPMRGLITTREAILHEHEPTTVPAPEAPLPDGRAPVLREPFPRAFADQNLFLQPWLQQTVVGAPGPLPVPLVEDGNGELHFYLLHLFSGRRRDDDCEAWAHRLIGDYFPGIHVHVIAVDTAIHCELGNVLGPCYATLQSLCQRGVFSAMITGPPCETWTAARHLPPPPGRERPRPLRSATRPWGLIRLDAAELRQLGTGSSLFLRSAALELRVALAGGGSVMEHPRTPDDPEYASVWRTMVQQGFLGCLDAARICQIHQFQFGAASVKPTNLRAVGLAGFLKFMHEEKDFTLPKPQYVLAGYDDFEHSFRTSAAKEYPPALCRALISSTFRALAARRRQHGTRIVPYAELADAEKSWMTAVEQAGRLTPAFGRTFLPDYQPHV